MGVAARVRERVQRAVLGVTATELRFLRAQAARHQRERLPSGVKILDGKFDYEFNDALKGDKRFTTYEKMEADAHVKGALRNIALPLQTAEWDITPGSDTPRDKEIAEFVAANLLRKNGERYGQEYWSETPWKAQRLPEVLTMLIFGFAMFHKSWRLVNGKLVYQQLKWLEPSSIDPRAWEMDNQDRLISIRRTYRDPANRYRHREPIPIDELALYVWDVRGARLEGRPFIRSMYGPWFRKDFVQRNQAIWSQKTGAPVPYGIFPHSWPDEYIPIFEEFIQSLRGTAPAESWGAFPAGSDGTPPTVGYAGADQGELDRSTHLVESENLEIAHAGGTKQMMLGETASGSRALGQSQGVVEMTQVEAVAEIIAEYEAHGVGNVRGVIEDLVDVNFAGVKEYPRLVCPKINPFQRVAMVRDLVIPAVAARLLPNHTSVRRHIADVAGLDIDDDALAEDPEPVVPVVVAPGNKPNTKPNGKPDGETGTDAEDDEDDEPGVERVAAALAEGKEKFRARIAGLLAPKEDAAVPGGGFRKPTMLEATVCNLAAIDGTLRAGERDVLTAMRDIRGRMRDEIMARVRVGKISVRNLGTQRRSRFRGASRSALRVESELTKVAGMGTEHVQDELGRQRRR